MSSVLNLTVSAVKTPQIMGFQGWRINWQMSNFIPITADEALKAQHEAGYHSLGYGFYGFDCQEVEPGLYVATWMCARSAD